MKYLRCQYGTSISNKAFFHLSKGLQNQKFKSLHYPFQRFCACLAHMHNESTFQTNKDFSCQQSATTVRCTIQNNSMTSNLKNGCDNCHCLNRTPNVEKISLETPENNFWGAVGLIVGTAVGPGMLGLPAATIKSGLLPSTLALVISWLYVISSIILVAELSFAVMEEDGLPEVSFTTLARKTLGKSLGSFAALIYASLSFSLLVACVSGIGSIVSQCFPRLSPVVANGLLPTIVGVLLWLFPFKAIDLANRFLCIMMLFSIIALVGIGVFVGRTDIFGNFRYASWEITSVLPAIPVAVLTFGFHVITPFVCKIAGNNIKEARKAILFGGTIPLFMVLSWNLIVLGLSGKRTTSSTQDPILLLLSVNSSALSAVQCFAFSALATSFIGYVVSLPKQILDTLELIFSKSHSRQEKSHKLQAASHVNEAGKVGLITFMYGKDKGNAGKVSYSGLHYQLTSQVISASAMNSFGRMAMPFVFVLPVLISCLSPSIFSKSLDYAGIYANCFLFGILPPLMMHIYQRQKKLRLTAIPGGNVALLLLFSIAVALAFWH